MFSLKNITTIQFDSGKDLINIMLTNSHLISSSTYLPQQEAN